MREVLLPLPGAPRTPWVGIGRVQRTAFEVVLERQADRRTVGLEAAASGRGFAERTAILRPSLSKIRMSGVNGLFAASGPPYTPTLLLHFPGRPVPDSST